MQGWSASGWRSPPTGVPFVRAPTLIPPNWDSRGFVGLDRWEFVRKRRKGFFSLTLFPISHLLLGQGLIPVFQQFYLEGHTLLTDTAMCALWLLKKNTFQAPIDFLK